MNFRLNLTTLLCCLISQFTTPSTSAQVVPGMGTHLAEVGDDFEEPGWTWNANDPKSSSNIDRQQRRPLGASNNERWLESAYRGQPDLVKIVPTPEGGLAGSEHAMLLQTYFSAIPGRASSAEEANQDDLMLNVRNRLGGFQPVSRSPNCVVRVYLPPFDRWQQRPGAHFGLRADVVGVRNRKSEESWPGIFLQFHPARTQRDGQAAASIILRGRESGDYLAKRFTETGWWTLGMSFTPDGRCHYYASPGVDDLTEADRIASHFPYSFRITRFNSFYFNIFNQDNGRSWSTPFILDDPALYVIP